MSLSHVLDSLRRDSTFMSNVTAWQILPARPARTAPIPTGLHPALIAGLQQRGIRQLYTHQRQAIDHVMAGHNLAVVTPTASGKTLCYNLPVLHELLSHPGATALYLFPTKALAHDQLEEIRDWVWGIRDIGDDRSAIPHIPVATYDGDTPSAQRAQIRRQSRLIITNPDMLHVGILPYHAAWTEFFAGLRAVVVDEMHVYRGVFGSHVANVLRRLRRVAAFYGSHPRFILTSATIANPQQLAEGLVEAPISVIDENGAPQGEKHIVLYNPPLYDPARGLRRSSVLESQDLATRLLLGGVQTILFGRSRLTVEVLLTYIRERLARVRRGNSSYQGLEVESHAPSSQYLLSNIHSALRGYRGGYLPEERRSIEAGLRSGEVRGVVTTNALELGIDIGQLEAAVICGYPGTIASTWQQMGRAGRTADASLAILVATAGALDQYIVNHPQYLLEQSPEHALVNPDNLMLLVDQMRCAAFELPFQPRDPFGHSSFVADVLALLKEQGEIGEYAERCLWQGDSYPAHRISLRSTGGDAVVIQAGAAEAGTQVVGEIDAASAPLLVHAGAVYIHEGQSYLVETLDLENRLARVAPAAVDFYTEANSRTEIEVLAIHDRKEVSGAVVYQGELAVTVQITDYRRVRHYTHENLGSYPLDYPPQTLETNGYWFEVSAQAQARLMQAGQWHDSPNDYGPNWQEQRRRVRKRDGYRCKECGTPEPPGGQHDVHHLIPFRSFGYVPGLNERYKTANHLGNLILLCRRCHQRIESGVRTRTGMDGLSYALQNLAPLYLMCDRSDIGVSVVREAGNRGTAAQEQGATQPATPRIYIFERIAAGLGFSRQLFEDHAALLTSAAQLIRACGCRYGCPACVGPVPLSGESDVPLLNTRQLTLSLLHVLQPEVAPEPPAITSDRDEIVF